MLFVFASFPLQSHYIDCTYVVTKSRIAGRYGRRYLGDARSDRSKVSDLPVPKLDLDSVRALRPDSVSDFQYRPGPITASHENCPCYVNPAQPGSGLVGSH